ncbi:MAG TPA: hypothetical protein VFZ27_15045 [Terriglobia bacterium]|nr:hypothetical protein [Terriglobia bacterium]
MFGKMTMTELLQTEKDEPLESSVGKLVAITDGAEIARWVQFRAGLLLFLVVPGDPESGAFYLLDRKAGTWYWVDFEDEKYGGYSEADFECLMSACRFARLVERPQLLATCLWRLAPGAGPELLSTLPRKFERRERNFNAKFNLTNPAVRA